MPRIKNFLINTFIGGLVVMLPIFIFIFLIQWIVIFIGDIVEPIISIFPFEINIVLAKILAFAIFILFSFSVGLFIRTNFGTQIIDWFEENTLKKLPLYTTIKETVKHFVGNDVSPFSKVVMVKPYGGETKMLGFVTSELKNDTLAIFIPTSPNPTSGFVVFLPKDKVEYVDIKIEEAMRTIIGLGKGIQEIKIKD